MANNTSMFNRERFMVVAFADHQAGRKTYSNWPQHMTVMQWMAGYRLQATNRIILAVREFEPLQITIDGEADFGPEGEVKVWTIAENAALNGLHLAILDAAQKYGTQVEDMTYAGKNYHPHIAQKEGQPLRYVGEELLLSELSVIGKTETGKTIYRNIGL